MATTHLPTSWIEFLVASGARFTEAGFAFGNEARESAAARDSTIISPLTHLGIAAFSGDDATDYLHKLLTSDVKRLGPDTFQHSAWCSPKGRMLANFILYRSQNNGGKDGGGNSGNSEYRALLAAGLLESTLKRMRMYVLRSKVALSSLSDDLTPVGLSGPDAAEILRSAFPEALNALPTLLPENGIAEFDGGTLLRLDAQRYIAIVAPEIAIALWKAAAGKATPAGNAAWRWLDIRAGLPMVTEATEEKFVPQMIGLEKTGGVSFTKGCYPGQEIVARSHYLGQLKRHLYRLRLPASGGFGESGTVGKSGESRESGKCNEPLRAGDAIFDAMKDSTRPDSTKPASNAIFDSTKPNSTEPANAENTENSTNTNACGTVLTAAPSPDGGFDALAVLLDEAARSGKLRTRDGQAFDSAEAVEFPEKP